MLPLQVLQVAKAYGPFYAFFIGIRYTFTVFSETFGIHQTDFLLVVYQSHQ